MFAAEVLSEWHAPVWGSSLLSVGRPVPLLGMSTAWYPSRQMKCLSHRKPGCEQQYFRGEVLWVARVSLNMHQLRERTPEVWDFFLVQLSLVDEQKLPAFLKKSELQTHPLSNFYKGTAGATWAQIRPNPLTPESRGRAWSGKSIGLGAGEKITLGEELVHACACEPKTWALFLLHPPVASWIGMQFLVVLSIVAITSRSLWCSADCPHKNLLNNW